MIRIWNYGIAGGKEQDNCKTATLVQMNLERRVFDFFGYQFIGTRKTLYEGKNTFAEGYDSG